MKLCGLIQTLTVSFGSKADITREVQTTTKNISF